MANIIQTAHMYQRFAANLSKSGYQYNYKMCLYIDTLMKACKISFDLSYN